MRIAPDSNKGKGLPSGPCGSSMAGILLLGLSERNSGDICSLASKSTRCGSYARPVSSSITETLTPFGVGSEYSWIRSGCRAGHFLVIGNIDRSGMLQVLGFRRSHQVEGLRVSPPQFPACVHAHADAHIPQRLFGVLGVR